MERMAVDQLLVVLAAPRVLGVTGTALRRLPVELLPALRRMIVAPRYYKGKYRNPIEAWLALNPGRNYDEFRTSHGWVRGVHLDDEPYKRERSFIEAARAYEDEMTKVLTEWIQYQRNYPEAHRAQLAASRLVARTRPLLHRGSDYE